MTNIWIVRYFTGAYVEDTSEESVIAFPSPASAHAVASLWSYQLEQGRPNVTPDRIVVKHPNLPGGEKALRIVDSAASFVVEKVPLGKTAVSPHKPKPKEQ